jgi:hypothetical protein
MKISDVILPLLEGRGIYARSPSDPPFTAVVGNKFNATQGDPYQFQGVQSYPPVGKYPDAESLTADAAHVDQQAVAQAGNPIIWANKQTSRHRGFALAQFVGPSGKPLYFGKYFDEILPSMMHKWDNDELPGLRPELKASKKARAGFKPQDLLGSTDTFANGTALLQHIQGVTTVAPNILEGIAMIGQKQLPVFKGEKANLEAIRDNLGEVLQSIALTYGLVGGEADDARKQVLHNAPWNKLQIHFPSGKTFGLVDFYLRAGNFSLGVSSKGAKGAPASVKNLLEGIANAKKAGQDLEAQYPVAANIVKTISGASMIDGPLKLAIDFNLITAEQAQDVVRMIRAHTTENPPEWTKPWTDAFKMKSAQGWNYGYWVMSAVAASVAERVNSTPDFSNGCIEFLNYASMMQMYTSARANGEDVAITGFNAVYPPNFQGTIALVAGKSYYASGINQKYVFDFRPA